MPKISSLGIMDLAGFIAPDCPTKIVGIRQGEKIHETLVSRDEARNTLEHGEYYLIKSDNPFFKSSVDEKKYKPVSADFEYRSDINSEWVTKEQVDKMIAPFLGEA